MLKMSKSILPAPKMSLPARALRLALLPPCEKTKPIYASKLRFSVDNYPTIPTLPPLISPLSRAAAHPTNHSIDRHCHRSLRYNWARTPETPTSDSSVHISISRKTRPKKKNSCCNCCSQISSSTTPVADKMALPYLW